MTDIERLDLAIDNAEKILGSLREFRNEIGDITKLRQEVGELRADYARIKQMLLAASRVGQEAA
jgi:hypothetical protein